MIEEGYAWAYDGGTKQKDFEELVRSDSPLVPYPDGKRSCRVELFN